MKAADVQKGLDILLRALPDASICAEHDEIYVGGPRPSSMGEAEVALLEKLGWMWLERELSWRVFV